MYDYQSKQIPFYYYKFEIKIYEVKFYEMKICKLEVQHHLDCARLRNNLLYIDHTRILLFINWQYQIIMATHKIIAQVKTFIPPLLESMHKGQSGKIAVIGGSFEYTGISPFFSYSLQACKKIK